MKRPAPTSHPFGPHTRKWILNVASMGAASLAYADISVLEAAYFKTWVDFEIKTSMVQYNFQRTYRSRSLHQGLFGLGWCTDFEKTLEEITEQRLVLRDCTQDVAQIFHKQKNDYVSQNIKTDKIIFKDGKYLRSMPDGRTQSFDFSGRLLSFKDRRQQNFELQRSSSGSLIKVQINRSITIDFVQSPRMGELVQVRAPGTAAFFYHLKNRNLESVRQKGEFLYQYTYDDHHNLTGIKVTGHPQEKMKYNPQQDWLIQHEGPDRCLTHLDYELKTSKSFEVRQTTACPGQNRKQQIFDVFLKDTADGGQRLDYVTLRKPVRSAASSPKGI